MATAGEQYKIKNAGDDPHFTRATVITSPLSLVCAKGRLKGQKKCLNDSESPFGIVNSSILSDKSSPFAWIKTPRSKRKCEERFKKENNQSNRVLAEKFLNKSENRIESNTAEPTGLSEKNGDKLKPLSKLHYVEKWLTTNPSKLAPSPVSLYNEDSSCLEPDLKDVMVAIYGPKCSKTELKKTLKKTQLRPATEGKMPNFPEALCNRNGLKNTRPVRRRIFKENNSPPRTVSEPEVYDVGNTPKQEDQKERRKKAKKRKISCEGIDVRETDSDVIASAKVKNIDNDGNSCKKQKYDLTSPDDAPRTSSKVSGTKTPQRTFLASLSVSTPTSIGHPEAKQYKINFEKKKDELVTRLYKLYNAEVFGNGLPLTMDIKWNPRMRGTAGYTKSKRNKISGERSSRIELSQRVLDRADRVRDTLIHEMCHAASWVIDSVIKGHGPVWQRWARKAMARFPELPPIRRCHNYEIAAKYTYRCMKCGYAVKRQSKSIDLDRKCCGYCLGKFELLYNKKKSGKGAEEPQFDTTRTLKKPNPYAIFVKENYKKLQAANADKNRAQILKLIGEKYAEYKGTPKNMKCSTSFASTSIF